MASLAPDTINTCRGVAVWALRLVSITLFAVGAYLILKRIAFGVGVRDFEAALTTWMDIGETHSFYRGVSMIIVGAALGVGAKPIARWALPVPDANCPACGYEQAPARGGRCPECGLPAAPMPSKGG